MAREARRREEGNRRTFRSVQVAAKRSKCKSRTNAENGGGFSSSWRRLGKGAASCFRDIRVVLSVLLAGGTREKRSPNCFESYRPLFLCIFFSIPKPREIRGRGEVLAPLRETRSHNFIRPPARESRSPPSSRIAGRSDKMAWGGGGGREARGRNGGSRNKARFGGKKGTGKFGENQAAFYYHR